MTKLNLMSVTEVNFTHNLTVIEGNPYSTNGVWLQTKNRTWWLRSRRTDASTSYAWRVSESGESSTSPVSSSYTLAPVIRLG